MKCLIMNISCENKFLCCHFCKVKYCKMRCMDKYKKCKYFEKTDVIESVFNNKDELEEL